MHALRSILYLEDDLDIQTIVQISLESAGGLALCVCSSGPQALAQARTFAADLFLLDVMLPGMDGCTTLRELRKLPGCAHTPAIFMTANLSEEALQEYLALGAVGVIRKPFDPLTLPQEVLNLWHQHCAKQP